MLDRIPATVSQMLVRNRKLLHYKEHLGTNVKSNRKNSYATYATSKCTLRPKISDVRSLCRGSTGILSSLPTTFVSSSNPSQYRYYSSLERSYPSALLRKGSTLVLAPVRHFSSSMAPPFQDITINIHFTRKCNYKCYFCFHTSDAVHSDPKANIVLSEDELKTVLLRCKDAGALKVNFAGGEPLLKPYQDMVGRLLKYAKKELKYDSTSIISNGSMIQEDFFQKYADNLNILGISCDSADENIHKLMGRGIATKGANKITPSKRPWAIEIETAKMLPNARSGLPPSSPALLPPKKVHNHVQQMKNISAWCKEYGPHFKVNTVVAAENKLEFDMYKLINEVDPMRWKVFQVLPLEGENYLNINNKNRDVRTSLISNDEFEAYVNKNRKHLTKPSILKEENNDIMSNSYIVIDEYSRMLDSSSGAKTPTKCSILKDGVKATMDELMKNTKRKKKDMKKMSETAATTLDDDDDDNGNKGNDLVRGFDKEKFDKRGGDYRDEWK